MARGDKPIQMNISNARIVEVSQNSWEEENLLLLTTLTDEQITKVLAPLLEEERNSEDGEVIYANDDLASKLSETYPDEIVYLYSEPDYLQL
jgi:hypothetical protein